MGLSFHTEHGPFASIHPATRKFLFEALVAADAGWVTRGDVCPDCMYGQVARASVAHALKVAREHIEAKPKLWAKDATVWTTRRSTRVVIVQAIDYLLEELEEISSPIIFVEDDYRKCDHPRVHTPKSQVRKIKEMAWMTR